MNVKATDAGFLFASMVLVNAGNYLINLILGRALGPALFAEASVIATGVLMLSFLAVGIQLTAAKFAATYSADRKEALLQTFGVWLNFRVFCLGLLLGALLILLSPLIQSFLHFKSFIPIALIGLGLPFYFTMSAKRGIAQGREEFKLLALTYLAEMLLRFSFTFILVLAALKYFNQFTTTAVSLGFVASFFGAVWLRSGGQNEGTTGAPFSEHRAVLQFVWIILFYEFSQILINNSDVILTKHFFSDTDAGLYAAVALIGRVVFFGTWTIVTLLFPKVIQKEQAGEPHLALFWKSFAITATFGAAIILACALFPNFILGLLFGPKYLSVAPLLWKYALGTTIFACANVFAYYYLSLNKYLPVVLTVCAGLLQLALIYLFHDQLVQVIHVQILVMSGLLLSMICYQLYDLATSKSKIPVTNNQDQDTYEKDKAGHSIALPAK